MRFSIAVVTSVLVAMGVAMPIPTTSKAPRMDGSDLFSMIEGMGGLDGVLKSIQISSPLNSALGQ